MKFFWGKIWVMTIPKNAKFLVWWVYWMRNKGLVLPTFCTFQTPLTLLAYSALLELELCLSSSKCKYVFSWAHLENMFLRSGTGKVIFFSPYIHICSWQSMQLSASMLTAILEHVIWGPLGLVYASPLVYSSSLGLAYAATEDIIKLLSHGCFCNVSVAPNAHMLLRWQRWKKWFLFLKLETWWSSFHV